MPPRRLAIAWGLALLGYAGSLLAQAPAPAPAADSVTIYLMTMGQGGEVWERFGHNAIVVEDHRTGRSYSYNYGMFSFRQENFLLRFIQGRMLYWMARRELSEDLQTYVRTRRSVWLQELEFAPTQALALRDFLEWNVRPENTYYRYDYYRDNCSTRVRDALNRFLAGAIRKWGDTLLTDNTYRSHTLRLTANSVPIYTGLDLLLGAGADRRITAWEEMFLPLELREHVRHIQVRGTDGRLRPLVRQERTLFESDAYPERPEPPKWTAWYLLAGLILGVALAVLGYRARVCPIARGSFLAVALVWCVLSGVAGVVIVGLWAFTDHAIAAWNANAFQATAVALALAVALPVALRRPGWRRGAVALAAVVAGLSVVGLALELIPVWPPQANAQMLALAVPANLGLAAGVRWALTRR